MGEACTINFPVEREISQIKILTLYLSKRNQSKLNEPVAVRRKKTTKIGEELHEISKEEKNKGKSVALTVL